VHNVKQESELQVITPNEPGIFGKVLGTLAHAQINLRAVFAYSEKDKGIFFLVTSDNDKAEKSLKSLGYKVSTNSVVTAQVHDRIGVGAEIGALLGNAVIDIKHCYASSVGGEKVLLVLQTSDNKKAVETLR